MSKGVGRKILNCVCAVFPVPFIFVHFLFSMKAFASVSKDTTLNARDQCFQVRMGRAFCIC